VTRSSCVSIVKLNFNDTASDVPVSKVARSVDIVGQYLPLLAIFTHTTVLAIVCAYNGALPNRPWFTSTGSTRPQITTSGRRVAGHHAGYVYPWQTLTPIGGSASAHLGSLSRSHLMSNAMAAEEDARATQSASRMIHWCPVSLANLYKYLLVCLFQEGS